MEYRAVKRVRLYGGEKDSSGRGKALVFKANKRQVVPQWVLDKDPSLYSKVEPLGGPEPEPAPAPLTPPPASQPQASDDGPGAEDPAGATPTPPAPVPAPQEPPRRRGRPKKASTEGA